VRDGAAEDGRDIPIRVPHYHRLAAMVLLWVLAVLRIARGLGGWWSATS
jgi:hypothetical protein